jgi:hypothetical protein
MPWYKAGTVSVVQNSNTVTGTGTSFIANSRVGDAFRGPDGGWYEVTNIASDTALSISPNYQGPSNAAGVYALAPMQGYVKQSADALRALVNQFGGVLAVLGTDPTLAGVRTALNLSDTGGLSEGSNKYFTDARVRGAALTGLLLTDASAVVATDAVLAAFGKLQAQANAASISISNKAAKGANNDITSLSALTTALSLAQGGTGVTSIAALLAALQVAGAFGKTNAVGTVSQASGIPTGAIIETGSNASGTYIKLLDGTMICFGTTAGVDQTTTSIPYTASVGFPAAFANTSYKVFLNIASVNVSNTFSGYARGNVATTSAFQIVQFWSYVQTYSYGYIAIGRWF